MSGSWLDPLGLRRVADTVSTAAVRALVGRRLEVDGGRLAARIAEVRQAAPHAAVGAALSGQLGLWRRLDLDLDEVRVGSHGFDLVSIVAADVRVPDSLPQRLLVRSLTVRVAASPAQTQEWIAHTVPGREVWVEGDHLLARSGWRGLPGIAELDPFVEGRRAGVRVERARVGGRTVTLPSRLHRTASRELAWLPPGAELTGVNVAAGAVTVTATVERHEVAIDVPRLLADLATRRADAVISVLLQG